MHASVMGANQGKEDETPTSPKSPRVAPVDIASRGDETPVPALLDKEASPGERRLDELEAKMDKLTEMLQTLIDKK